MKGVVCFILACSSLFTDCELPKVIEVDAKTFCEMDRVILQLDQTLDKLNGDKGANLNLQNQFVQGVIDKNALCNQLENTLVSYFLQKRLKRSDPFIERKLLMVHSLLSLLRAIKEHAEFTYLFQLKREMSAFQKLCLQPKPVDTKSYRQKMRRASPRFSQSPCS